MKIERKFALDVVEEFRKEFVVKQRHSFLMIDGGVRKVNDRYGNYVDFVDTHAMFDAEFIERMMDRVVQNRIAQVSFDQDSGTAKYKDFVAKIEFDVIDEMWFGHVVVDGCTILFDGVDIDSAKKNFADAIEEYLAWDFRTQNGSFEIHRD